MAASRVSLQHVMQCSLPAYEQHKHSLVVRGLGPTLQPPGPGVQAAKPFRSLSFRGKVPASRRSAASGVLFLLRCLILRGAGKRVPGSTTCFCTLRASTRAVPSLLSAFSAEIQSFVFRNHSVSVNGPLPAKSHRVFLPFSRVLVFGTPHWRLEAAAWACDCLLCGGLPIECINEV